MVEFNPALPDQANLGDEGHITDHNTIVAGLHTLNNGKAEKSYVDALTVDTARLVDNSVTRAKLADNSATAVSPVAPSSPKIGSLWVDSSATVDTLVFPLATASLADGSVTSAKIADGTIATGDIADQAVTAAKIANDTITATQIATNAVTSDELADNAVDTNAIANGAVTDAKLAGSITASKVIGTALVASTVDAKGDLLVGTGDNTVARLAAGADGTLIGYDSSTASGLTTFKVGNLLTANQASGGDTLGNTTGFGARFYGALDRTTDAAWQGAGCFKLTSESTNSPLVGSPGGTSGIPVTGLQMYTFLVRSKAATVARNVWQTIDWFDAAGALISDVGSTAVANSASTFTQHSLTVEAPASAAYARANFGFRHPGGALEVHYFDGFSFHKGAGGDWQMPGVPIPGQSRIAVNNAVDLSGTGAPEGVIAAAPGSTYLQTDATNDVKGWIKWIKATGTGSTGWVAGPEADTGTRLVAVDGASWSGNVHIRRRGNIVEVKPDASRLTMPAAGNDTVMTLPTGFRAIGNGFTEGMSFNHATNYVFPILMSSGGVIYYYASASRSAGNALSFTLVFQTAADWPTSLPGSAV